MPQPPLRTHRPRWFVLFVLIVALVVFALAWQSEPFRQWRLSRMSLEDLRSTAESDERDMAAWSAYAERLTKAGKGAEAAGAYEKATAHISIEDMSPGSRALMVEAAHTAARFGSEAQAEKLIKRAVMHARFEPGMLLAQGILAMRKKDFTAAKGFFEQTTQAAPRNAEGWNRLGTSLLALQQPRLAEAPLRRAVQLTPNEAGPHADLAETLAQSSRFREAQQEYLVAAKIAPDSAEYASQYALASASAARSDEEFEKAATALTSAMQQSPDDIALPLTMAGLQTRFAHMDDARRTYESVVARLPDHSDAWFNLSAVYDRLGDRASAKIARAKFQELMDRQTAVVELTKRSLLKPQDAALHVALSDAQRRAGDNDAAYRELRRACELAPTNVSLRARLDAASHAMAGHGLNGAGAN